MRYVYLLLLVCVVCGCFFTLHAQHYLTVGIGFSGMNNNSQDLDQFTETYNFVNGFQVGRGLQGFGWSLGVRPEVGYRYIGKWNGGLILGFQNFSENDFARFADSQSRRLELKMRSLFADLEFGLPFKNWLLNGVASFYFLRKTEINSTFNRPVGVPDNQTLSGLYTSDSATSLDLGFAVGYFQKRLLVMGKVTFPVYTGGEAAILNDDDSEKAALNIDGFPNDYLAYAQGETYKGVASDVDGVKVSLVLVYTIGLRK